MLKARIKNLDKYIEFLTENTNTFVDAFHNTFQGMWNQKDVKRLDKAFDNLFSHWSGEGYFVRDSELETINYINQYIEEHGFYWDVPVRMKGYAALHYGKVDFIISEESLEYKEEKDYSHIAMSALNAQISDNVSMLPAELNDKSLSDVQKESGTIKDKIAQLKQEEQDIKDAKTGELKEMQEQIDALIAEMNQKKEVLMQELNRKMELFEQQKKELEAQIYMLQTEIYSIRCYMGETVELAGIRDGSPAPVEDPVVLNQKILYLDEDLARMMSIYGFQLENYKLLEEAIKFNDEVFEAFCPQKKCITFFRVSRKAERTFYNNEINCLDSYAMLHGKKIGFAVRNGEKLYLGWMEEEWEPERKLTFEENVILRAGKTEVTAGDEAVSTPLGERVSRMFALNVLRGLLTNKKILDLPDGEDLLKPSKYIIHNYADAWLDDNRYGDFATLVKNLHYYDREKDKILLISSLSESYDSHKTGPVRGLEDAQVNRTHDCSVKSGLNTINMIDESGNVYISVEKKYSFCGARSNFLIQKGEFLNLTFMNSLWLSYYIMTKKIGDFGRKQDQFGRTTALDYAYLIPFFKQALEYLREREKEEATLLSQYVNLDDYMEWQVLLSNWKISKKVHRFTNYQAKRFAKYLEAGEYFEMTHLFEGGYQSDKPDLHGSYSSTDVEGHSGSFIRWCNSTGENHPLYGFNGDYEKQRFTKDSTLEEIKERAELDKQKLLCIKQEVDSWLQEKNVALKEIYENFKRHVDKEKAQDEEVRGHWMPDWERVYRKNTLRDMLILSYMDAYEIRDPYHLPETEYNYLNVYICMNTKIFKKLLPLHYYRFLQYECFDKILEIADDILEERWNYAVKQKR